MSPAVLRSASILLSLLAFALCAALGGCAPHVEVRTPTPPVVGNAAEMPPMAVAAVTTTIPLGSVIGKKRYTDPFLSNHARLSGVPQSRLATVAYDTLKSRNYNVPGNPAEIFRDKSADAELFIGAVISKLDVDIFYESLGTDYTFGKASAVIGVEWQIYHGLERRVTYKTFTSGSANVGFDKDDLDLVVCAAFENALLHLLADKGFNDALAQAGTRLNADGLLITNQHVVGNAARVRVIAHDGRKADATVLARDARRDVAAVAVSGLNLPPLKIRKAPVEIGEEVYAVGSPLDIKLAGAVTKGIVSSFRKMKGESWIQGDAAINQGNSGGPLVDAKGNVVGISTMGITDAQGIFFYGPINDALARLLSR